MSTIIKFSQNWLVLVEYFQEEWSEVEVKAISSSLQPGLPREPHAGALVADLNHAE